jgi:hypothetical protein
MTAKTSQEDKSHCGGLARHESDQPESACELKGHGKNQTRQDKFAAHIYSQPPMSPSTEPGKPSRRHRAPPSCKTKENHVMTGMTP